MSDSTAGRAAQKARTRARIRTVAQELFAAQGFDAVPITEIAAAAEVSVQTVFNHFSSKEELFFADRVSWVAGPAEAVRARAAHERPKEALRRHLVGTVEGYARATVTDPAHRRMIEVLEDTPALLAYELSLHDQAVAGLADALAESWGCADEGANGSCRVLAEVTASVWMAAVRTIVVDMRSTRTQDEAAICATVALTEQVLGELASGLSFAETRSAGTDCQVA